MAKKIKKTQNCGRAAKHLFQELHSQEHYEGTGMGLAICELIVENHNGIITATGKLNKGAQFDN